MYELYFAKHGSNIESKVKIQNIQVIQKKLHTKNLCPQTHSPVICAL